jgi:mannose-6-phosphate isomerase-like protein (cupin superfamily)
VDHPAASVRRAAQDVRMTPLTRPAVRTARTASAAHGAALTFETLVEGDAAYARVRMHDDTLLRVIAGIVRVTIDAEVHRLGTGDEIVIPAGSAHTLASAGGVARLVTGLRAVRR